MPVRAGLQRLEHALAGAFVIGDNAMEQSPGYLDYVRNPRNGYLSLALPFEAGRGNELTVVTRRSSRWREKTLCRSHPPAPLPQKAHSVARST
jgi:hypothetical protein